jgi:hypothetical protein
MYLYLKGRKIDIKSKTAGDLKVVLMKSGLMENHADSIIKLWQKKIIGRNGCY